MEMNKVSLKDRIRWFFERKKYQIMRMFHIPDKGSIYWWAKKEVDIACKREAPDRKKGEWDYGCACYESALKAYKSLLEDGHSGMSIVITKNILARMIEGKPLTPITDEDFKADRQRIMESPEYLKEHGLKSDMQCSRMSALFRQEALDGEVTYLDVDRAVGRNKTSGFSFGSGKVRKIIDERFPITMPYMPTTKPYIVVTDDCLVDPKEGDWDTEAYYEIITPEGEHIPLNEFYKCIGDERIPITEDEYNERKKLSEERRSEAKEW